MRGGVGFLFYVLQCWGVKLRVSSMLSSALPLSYIPNPHAWVLMTDGTWHGKDAPIGEQELGCGCPLRDSGTTLPMCDQLSS